VAQNGPAITLVHSRER